MPSPIESSSLSLTQDRKNSSLVMARSPLSRVDDKKGIAFGLN